MTLGVPVVVKWKQIQLVSMRMRVRSLALLSGLGIWHCHEVWCRSQMQLRSCVAVAVVRLAVTAPIQSLAWEFPYAADVALKRQ